MSANSDQVYIVTLQRSCNADDVHSLVSELTTKHEDEGQPEFTVDIQNVMKSGKKIAHWCIWSFQWVILVKMITIGNPSEACLEFLREHAHVKNIEADSPVQAMGL